MKRRTLALILAAALTVTSVEGTAVMASAAEFTSEAAEEEIPSMESETDTFSSGFAEQEGEIASEEIGITDEETQEEEPQTMKHVFLMKLMTVRMKKK